MPQQNDNGIKIPEHIQRTIEKDEYMDSEDLHEIGEIQLADTDKKKEQRRDGLIAIESSMPSYIICPTCNQELLWERNSTYKCESCKSHFHKPVFAVGFEDGIHEVHGSQVLSDRANQVARIGTSFYSGAVHLGDYAGFITPEADRGRNFLLKIENERIVSIIGYDLTTERYKHDGQVAELHSLLTLPFYQHKGHGSKFVDEWGEKFSTIPKTVVNSEELDSWYENKTDVNFRDLEMIDNLYDGKTSEELPQINSGKTRVQHRYNQAPYRLRSHIFPPRQ